MSETVKIYSEIAAAALEIFGITLIIAYIGYSAISALIHFIKREEGEKLYHTFRHQIARGILLGLEVLVAADIINTVAVELTFYNLGVLAIVVLIRTFLSFTLEMESTGSWPWQKK